MSEEDRPDYERIVGKEACRYAKKSCRGCNGTGVLRIWAKVGAWRVPKIEPEIGLCGCCTSRLIKKYPDEVYVKGGFLTWKFGFSPKDKLEAKRERDTAGSGGDSGAGDWLVLEREPETSKAADRDHSA